MVLSTINLVLNLYYLVPVLTQATNLWDDPRTQQARHLWVPHTTKLHQDVFEGILLDEQVRIICGIKQSLQVYYKWFSVGNALQMEGKSVGNSCNIWRFFSSEIYLELFYFHGGLSEQKTSMNPKQGIKLVIKYKWSFRARKIIELNEGLRTVQDIAKPVHI